MPDMSQLGDRSGTNDTAELQVSLTAIRKSINTKQLRKSSYMMAKMKCVVEMQGVHVG